MALRVSRDAELDLNDIYAYGARTFGVAAADRYASELLRTLRLIADNPHLARERKEVGRPLRLYPFGAHHIIYTIASENVVILRVLGHRQDWQNLL